MYKHFLKRFCLSLLAISIYLISNNLLADNIEVGKPIIRNYTPREYNGYSQNWGFLQDDNGLLYVANGSGVLQYDGSEWRMLNDPASFAASAMVKGNDGNIYLVGVGEFGYFSPNKKGELKYTSLIERIPEYARNIHLISRIFNYEGALFFTYSNYLYCWKNNQMNITKLENENNKLFFIDNHLLIQESDKKISFIKKGKLEPIACNNIKGNYFIQIMPYNDSLNIAIERTKGLCFLNKISKNTKSLTIKPFGYNEASDFIRNNSINNAIRLSNGHYAICTARNGTIIINREGKITKYLNKKRGVVNDIHSNLFQDKQGLLWISTNNGISKTEVNETLTYWDDQTNMKGTVMSTIRCNGQLYVGTWTGLFTMDQKNASIQNEKTANFTQLTGLNAGCFELQTIKNLNGKSDLLIAASDGLHVLRDNKIKTILNLPEPATKICFSNKFKNIIYLSTYIGIYIIKYDKTKQGINYEVIGRIKGIDNRIYTIDEDVDGRAWFTIENSSLGYIKLSSIKKNAKTGNDSFADNYFNIEKQLIVNAPQFKNISSVFSLKIFDRMIFLTDNLILTSKIQNKKITFVPLFPGIPNSFYQNNSITQIFQDYKQNVWLQVYFKFSKSKRTCLGFYDKDKNYKFLYTPFKPLPSIDIYSFYPDNNGDVWFGADDILYKYSPSKHLNYNTPFNSLIREVTIGKDSVLFLGSYDNISSTSQSPEYTFSIPYTKNSLSFKFAAPSFFNEANTEYKYFLEGFDEKWSEWSSSNKKEYTNLPRGIYTFHVKAKNIFDIESKETTYRFTILSPWYFSVWAYLSYCILIAVILYIAIVITNRRLILAKIRLEKTVKERTSEVIARQKEIEEEKEKSEKLLLNILPYKIAEELKAKGSAQTQHYDEVSVMFADLKGFTTIAQIMEPRQLIKELDKRFIHFDDICIRYNIEKIKTIGDSYMCVGGLPIVNKTHAVNMILAAFEMLDFMSILNKEIPDGQLHWDLRIGIHSGPIIAGVVGKNKFAYDIWGDTVNTASRMESSSEAKHINISVDTYNLIKDFFVCKYRGKIPIKHKGEIDMYFVERIKPEFSNDEIGHAPNKEFMNKLATI